MTKAERLMQEIEKVAKVVIYADPTKVFDVLGQFRPVGPWVVGAGERFIPGPDGQISDASRATKSNTTTGNPGPSSTNMTTVSAATPGDPGTGVVVIAVATDAEADIQV